MYHLIATVTAALAVFHLLLYCCLCNLDCHNTTVSRCGGSAMAGDFAVYTGAASVDDHQPQQRDILQLQYTDVNTKACITASRLGTSALVHYTIT
jgi:hypothetical protein